MNRAIVISALLALALLAAAPAPAHGQGPVVSFDGPVLAGRNCGGTLFVAPGPLGSSGGPALAEIPIGNGWGVARAVDDVDTALSQRAPALALSPSESPLYIWQEANSRDGGDIFVAGTGAGGSGRRGVRVDDTGNTAVDQHAPTLTVDGKGRAHSVWQDRREGRGFNYDLYHAASNDGGLTWGPNQRVVTPTVRIQPNLVEPSLITGADGAPRLIWRAVGTTRSDIFSSRWDGSWSAPVRVNDNIAAERDRPTLALASDGDLLAAWGDDRGGTSRIYFARQDISGGATTWGADVAATPSNINTSRPSLAVAPGGAIYLAYQSGGAIYLIGSADGGATWSTPKRIDNNTGTASNPRLAVDRFGGVHCIWCRLQGSADILAARSTNGGQSWPTPTVLASTTGTAEPLALVADDHGSVFAAWSNGDDNDPVIYAAQWSGPRIFLPLLRSR